VFSQFKMFAWDLHFNNGWLPLKNIHKLASKQQCKTRRMLTTSVD
jgi:hypothetical protein